MIKGKKQSKIASELISAAKFLPPTLFWLVPTASGPWRALALHSPQDFLKDKQNKQKSNTLRPAQQSLGRNHEPTGFWQKPNPFACISVLVDLWHNTHEGWESASLESGPRMAVVIAQELLHLFPLFDAHLVRPRQEYPGEISACFVKSSWCRAGLTLCRRAWSSPKDAASVRAVGAMVEGPRAGAASPPVLPSGTWKVFPVSTACKGLWAIDNRMRSCEHRQLGAERWAQPLRVSPKKKGLLLC